MAGLPRLAAEGPRRQPRGPPARRGSAAPWQGSGTYCTDGRRRVARGWNSMGL